MPCLSQTALSRAAATVATFVFNRTPCRFSKACGRKPGRDGGVLGERAVKRAGWKLQGNSEEMTFQHFAGATYRALTSAKDGPSLYDLCDPLLLRPGKGDPHLANFYR